MREREQKGGRDRERKPLMTHEDGASFEKQEKYIMPKAKESIFGVLLMIYIFYFFLSEMHQNESAVVTNEWV